MFADQGPVADLKTLPLPPPVPTTGAPHVACNLDLVADLGRLAHIEVVKVVPILVLRHSAGYGHPCSNERSPAVGD